ncbi:hypothetical protein CAJAP_01945 [Camponotus japonicus]
MADGFFRCLECCTRIYGQLRYSGQLQNHPTDDILGLTLAIARCIAHNLRAATKSSCG